MYKWYFSLDFYDLVKHSIKKKKNFFLLFGYVYQYLWIAINVYVNARVISTGLVAWFLKGQACKAFSPK